MPSVALARTREALHIGWDKNDPKYAQVILHMLKIGATQTCCDSICSGINDIQERMPSSEPFRLSALLRRTDAKRENLSQQVP